MTVLANKIRLGAPNFMQLFGYIDLGGSVGGAELDYNPTNFLIEVDQSIVPSQVYKTKEECMFSVVLVQQQMSLVATAFGYPTTSIVTSTSGTQAAPATPTLVVNAGGASGAYSYQVVAIGANGDSVPSTAVSTTVGPTTLTPVNSITVNWTTTTGAVGFRVIRSAAPTGYTTGIIGSINNPAVLTFTDTGYYAQPYTAAGAAPIASGTDVFQFGGTIGLQQGTLDWTVPKNDLTTNLLRGHLNRVFSAKSIKIDYKRDKHTEMNKVTFQALADLTQVVGQQLGYLTEQYLVIPLPLFGHTVGQRLVGAVLMVGLALFGKRRSIMKRLRGEQTAT